jgi:hypothetical protein
MKLLVCGDRDFHDKGTMESFILDLRQFGFKEVKPDVIIEGGARGADSLAREIAKENDISFNEVSAQWEKYGLRAGPIRNSQMIAMHPDLVIAFHYHIDNSRGTIDIINKAVKANIPTYLVEMNGARKMNL